MLEAHKSNKHWQKKQNLSKSNKIRQAQHSDSERLMGFDTVWRMDQNTSAFRPANRQILKIFSIQGYPKK